MKSYHQKQYAGIILILVTIFLTSSCTGSKSITPIEKPAGQNDMSLEKSYSKVIIQKFEVDQDLEKNYPGITVNCESALMNELLQVSSISQIEKARANSVRQRGALIVKTRVTTLKLAGSNAAPEMTANVRLIDSATGITIREKDLSTISSGNGSSDQMLPYNLGKIIAQYVAASLSGD